MSKMLMYFDGSHWWIRRVCLNVHDLNLDEKIYRCDKHLGGPYSDFDIAVVAMKQIMITEST